MLGECTPQLVFLFVSLFFAFEKKRSSHLLFLRVPFSLFIFPWWSSFVFFPCMHAINARNDLSCWRVCTTRSFFWTLSQEICSNVSFSLLHTCKTSRWWWHVTRGGRCLALQWICNIFLKAFGHIPTLSSSRQQIICFSFYYDLKKKKEKKKK